MSISTVEPLSPDTEFLSGLGKHIIRIKDEVSVWCVGYDIGTLPNGSDCSEMFNLGFEEIASYFKDKCVFLKCPFKYRTFRVVSGQNSADELRDSYPIVLNPSQGPTIEDSAWYSAETTGKEEILGGQLLTGHGTVLRDNFT